MSRLPLDWNVRWLRLARKDLRDAVRERTLYLTAGLFVLVGALLGYFQGGGVEEAGADRLLPVLAFSPLSLLVAVVAVGISHASIVGPRTDGSLQFLLGLPYGRADVVAGTYAGRAAVMGVTVTGGILALALAALTQGVVVSPLSTLLVFAFLLVLGTVFVAVSVGISAALRGRQVVSAASFGAFFLFFFLWQSLPGLIAYVLNGLSMPAAPPAWAPLFRAVNPLAAIGVLSRMLLRVGPDTVFLGGGALPSAPLAVVVLAGWLTLAPIAGYLRFRDDDL